MPILDLECECGSQSLVVDFTREPGMKYIYCRECKKSWSDADTYGPGEAIADYQVNTAMMEDD